MLAATRNTLVVFALLPIFTHQGSKSTGYIEVINDVRIFTGFTGSGEVHSFSSRLDSAYNGVWCSNVVDDGTFLFSGSWFNAGDSIVLGIMGTYIQVRRDDDHFWNTNTFLAD